jgi:hypothetical protein
MPGVARRADGEPLASLELVNQPFMITRGGGREIVLIRGVEPVAFDVHRARTSSRGACSVPTSVRWWSGSASAGRYVGASLGGDIEFGPAHWKVVGRARLGREGVRQRDLGRRGGRPGRHAAQGYSGVRLTLDPGTDLRDSQARIEGDGRFTLEAKPETDYYREQADTTQTLYVLVLTLAVIMATGAVFGALNTMYAAVASRTAEIGTLRALGFGRGAILRASSRVAGARRRGFLAGSVLAALGVLAVNTLLSGVQFSMMTFSVATVLLPSHSRARSSRGS